MIKIPYNAAHSAACYLLAHDENEAFMKFEDYKQTYNFIVDLAKQLDSNNEISIVSSAGVCLIRANDEVQIYVDPLRRHDPEEYSGAYILVNEE
jgi:hypothetical protein